MDIEGAEYPILKKLIQRKIRTINNYSTVSESLINEGFFREGFIINSDSVFLCFTLLITSCRLTKTYHYNDNQEHVFKIVKHLKNQYKYSNKRISEYLNSNGFLTTRTKRYFRPNDVYSL